MNRRRQGTALSRAGFRGRRTALAAEVMAIPRRHGKVPGTYFVTSRTWESRPLFKGLAACQMFVETLLRYRDQGAYLLHAFVLMPDHFHVLLTPSTDTTLERALQYIKGGSAHRIGKELELRFPVWQRGFSDHRIRDAEDYATHVRYIEKNPVAKKLVTVADDYPWSSAARHFRLNEPPQGLKPQVGDAPVGTAEAVP